MYLHYNGGVYITDDSFEVEARFSSAINPVQAVWIGIINPNRDPIVMTPSGGKHATDLRFTGDQGDRSLPLEKKAGPFPSITSPFPKILGL